MIVDYGLERSDEPIVGFGVFSFEVCRRSFSKMKRVQSR